MFAKDFNFLNEIYNQRIFREGIESGINVLDNPGTPSGPEKVLTQVTSLKPKMCSKCNCLSSKCECDENTPEEADMVFADKPAHSSYDHEGIEDHRDSHETNGYMAKQQCFRIAKMAAMLHELIKDEEELSPWIATKISQGFDDLSAVFAYKDYEQYRDEVEGHTQEVEEGTEQDFIDSINRGGNNIVNQIRRTVRHESTETIEKVLLECVKALEAKKRK